MKLDILCGPPGSGKSTCYKKLKAQHDEQGSEAPTYVNQDSQSKEGHFQLFLKALSERKHIVVDRMNFNKQQRERYITPAKAAGYETHSTIFYTPRKTCMERVLARKGHETIKDPSAAESAINLFFSKYEAPSKEEGLDAVKSIRDGPEDKPKAIICDLDNTLCDVSARVHFVNRNVEGQRVNWGAFFRGIANDEVNEPVAEVLRRYSVDHEIVYASGRPAEYRGPTEKWLRDRNLFYGHLFMRSSGDFRSDSTAKEIILDFDILPLFTPVLFLDDRDQIVKLWRGRGYPCWQVAPGNF